ncbi:MAG: SH3 domain-containing protein [Chitinophagaceae bacterium]|nr:SH3 domain-containing protein [Chitinophagaceae bacterium]
MRLLILTFALLQAILCFAQKTSVLYVASKGGLNIREKPSANAKVLDKIPYGTKITIIHEDKALEQAQSEGMQGLWRKVKYNNKTGYINDCYLFTWPPPRLDKVSNMKQYLAQVTAPHGTKVTVKSLTYNDITGNDWELNKQLFKNGAEMHEFMGHEYASSTYFLPDFTLQQGFLLCRLLPEFKDVFGEKDEFPTTSRQITKDGIEYNIKVVKFGESPDYAGPYTIERIIIEFTPGGTTRFEMYMKDNELVIFFSTGV